MKFSIRFADQIVGAFVILALAILIVVIFMLGKNQRWFVHDYQYMTYFSSASGISRGMPVLYKGFRIGDIKNIKLSYDDRVEVSFTIFNEYDHRVTEGSLVEMQSSPIPGIGNAFVFHPGKGTEKIPEGSVIPEVTSPEARQVFAMGLATVSKADDSIANIINQVTRTLEAISVSLAGNIESDKMPLEQIVKNVVGITADVKGITESLSEKLIPLLDNLETVSAMAAAPDGSLQSLLDSQGTLYTSIEGAIGSISGIMESLEKTAEFLPQQLPQVAILISELNVAVRSIQDVLTALSNNPLLRGGIPERTEAGPGGANSRNLEF